MKIKFILPVILTGFVRSGHTQLPVSLPERDDKPIIITAIPGHGPFSAAVSNETDLSIQPEQADYRFYSNFMEMNRPLFTYDSSEVYFLSPDIDRTNAGRFQYRVLQNGITVVRDWSDILEFAGASFAPAEFTKGMALLGGYKTNFSNYLRVEIRSRHTGACLGLAIVYWKEIRPVLLNIYTADQLDSFLARLQSSREQSLNKEELDKWKQLYKPGELDSSTGLPRELVLKPGENNIIFYLKGNIQNKEELEYRLLKGRTVLRPWMPNEFNNNFIWLKNLKAGGYQLEMRLRIQRQNTSSYRFYVRNYWFQTTPFRIGAGIAATLVLFLLAYLRKQQRKLTREKIKREKLKLEQKALRSQLNPHFLFNALGSIRMLMLKYQIQTADLYLVEFSHLLRQSLHNMDLEYVALAAELKILETYIKLERLRFHFHYEIQVDKKLEESHVKIPTLLIQPLVENSIKYGAGPKHEYGFLEVKYSALGRDLLISIADNGTGFDPLATTIGFGLRLVKDRVKLLNDELVDRRIILTFGCAENTLAIAQLTFKNWLRYAG